MQSTSQKDKYHMLSLTHRKSHVYILYEYKWKALRDTKGASKSGEEGDGGVRGKMLNIQ